MLFFLQIRQKMPFHKKQQIANKTPIFASFLSKINGYSTLIRNFAAIFTNIS